MTGLLDQFGAGCADFAGADDCNAGRPAMDWFWSFVDFFVHLNVHLGELIQQYGGWTYAILFLIIFCETGLVVTPFLPGDSLLFAVGTFAATGDLDLATVSVLLTVAAILGDTVNYAIGAYLGPKVLTREDSRFLKRAYLDKTHQFYEKYGAKTIVLARFVPIVRTFAPFVAGVGKMSYGKFATYNIVGGILWVAIFVTAGYLVGNVEAVQKNFTFVALGIVVVSVLPMVYEWVQHRRARG